MKTKKQQVAKSEKRGEKIGVQMSASAAERLAKAACESADVATALLTASND